MRIKGIRAILLLLNGAAATVAPATQQWNIVSIVTDDQARWAVGAYGNPDVRTPNMDRLAREGARFTNAFVNVPVCSPSRASFMTGLHASRFGITDYISSREDREGLGLPPSSITWPEVLQQNGYSTALIGKWHLGSQPKFHPTRTGFNYFYGFLGGGAWPVDPKLEVDGKLTKVTGAVPDLLGDAAVSFLDRQSSQPFALLLHFREPHLPYRPVPEQDAALFRNADVTVPEAKGADVEQLKRWTRDYYACVHAADRNIGRVLDKLDEAGFTSNTIVFFTSDHGYMIGHHTLHTKGNGHWIAGGVSGPKRPNMFDDSIRVPLLVRCPERVKPGTVIDTPVTNVDMFPTALSMAGIKYQTTSTLDGRSFSPLLLGEPAGQDLPVFGQYDMHNHDLDYMRMIRTTKWKLVRHYFTNEIDELYNLETDPGEQTNLFGKPEHAVIRADLQKQLVQWQKSIDDPILQRLPASALSFTDKIAGEE